MKSNSGPLTGTGMLSILQADFCKPLSSTQTSEVSQGKASNIEKGADSEEPAPFISSPSCAPRRSSAHEKDRKSHRAASPGKHHCPLRKWSESQIPKLKCQKRRHADTVGGNVLLLSLDFEPDLTFGFPHLIFRAHSPPTITNRTSITFVPVGPVTTRSPTCSRKT